MIEGAAAMTVHYFDPRPPAVKPDREDAPTGIACALAISATFWIAVILLAHACTSAVFGARYHP